MYRMSDELIQLISTLDEYFEGFFEKVTIINGSHTPVTISRIITNHMTQFGTIRQVNENLKTFDYINNEDIVISIVDHIGKLKVTPAYPTDKLTVDAYSAFMSNIFRDIYMGLYIDVSQLNRALTSTDRAKLGDIDIKHSDFLTSSETYSNCDLCFGMLNPLKQGVEMYPPDNGYSMSKVVDVNGKNRFRSLKILKNSFGSDDIRIYYRFLGECGAMTELPKASEMNQTVTGTNMTHYDLLTLKDYQVNSRWRKD